MVAAAASEAPNPTDPPEDMRSIVETKSTPELSQHVVEIVSEEEQAQKQSELQPESAATTYRDSLKQYDPLFEYGPEPRFSSQTARPTYSELYEEIYAKYNKPKVKLGPRPRPSLDSKRPKTSGSGELSVARPISSLPAGLRVANRRPVETKRPKSRDSSIVPSIAFPPPPPIPEIPQSPTFSYHSHRPASVRSMPNYGHRSSGITPEKQRLLKALELRKKQMLVKQEQEQEQEQKMEQHESEQPSASVEECPEQGDDALVIAGSSVETVTEGVSTAADTVNKSAVLQQPDEQPTSSGYAAALDDIKASMTHEDSSLSMMSSQAETDDLHSAVSASSPTSAQTQGSSCAPSTRPSSLSEDDHHIPEEDMKLDETHGSRDSQIEEPRESSQYEDGKESVPSSPTVVPEIDSSVASVEVTPETDAQPQIVIHDFASDSIMVKKSRRASTIFIPPTAQTNGGSKRRSIVFPQSESSAQQEGALTTEQKRKSINLPTPKGQSFMEVKEKRLTVANPIQIHLSAENSDAEYLSDDSFMEELQSATLEQAKPISVSKSPITSYFPRKSSVPEATTPKQSTYGQQKLAGLTPEKQGPRKMSGTWPPQSTADPVGLAKKINVSSGISQRIKALAEKSSRELSASPSAGPDTNTSMVAQRKSSFFSAPPSSNSPPGKLSSRLNRASFVPVAFSSSSPDRKTMIQPPKTADSTVYNVQEEPTKPESVQVTARIVRDPRIEKPMLTMPTESTPLELHQSPIIIDHQKSASQRPSSRSSKHSPSRMEPTSPVSNPPRSSSESSWRSFGRRMSETKAQSLHSLEIPEEKKEEKKEKKDSRTSKLFKRMSNISAISRKNQSSSNNNLAEEERQSYSLPSLREPPPSVQVGDLNIQFPDTLVSPSCTLILTVKLTCLQLWKRRWVEIDASGNLVLSLSKSNEQSKGITKRFHLSEFRTPYIPDQDRQELPNSVILDFLDGRTLQCACETYMAQTQILQGTFVSHSITTTANICLVLREAHDAWLAYGQL
jgi:hypothetical protein